MVQDRVREPDGPWPLHFVFGAQPLSQPSGRVLIYRPVGFTHRTKTEVVGPARQFPVERSDNRLRVLSSAVSSGDFAHRLADALHSFLRRYRAKIASSRLARVTSSKLVSEKLELLLWQAADPRLVLIHRQFQLR